MHKYFVARTLVGCIFLVPVVKMMGGWQESGIIAILCASFGCSVMAEMTIRMWVKIGKENQ